MLPASYLSAPIGVEEGGVGRGEKVARKLHCRVEVDVNSIATGRHAHRKDECIGAVQGEDIKRGSDGRG